jgi:hypothetical protein
MHHHSFRGTVRREEGIAQRRTGDRREGEEKSGSLMLLGSYLYYNGDSGVGPNGYSATLFQVCGRSDTLTRADHADHDISTATMHQTL